MNKRRENTNLLLAAAVCIFLNGLLFFVLPELEAVGNIIAFVVVQGICFVCMASAYRNKTSVVRNTYADKLKTLDFMTSESIGDDLDSEAVKLQEVISKLRKLSSDILSTTITVRCSGDLLYEDTKAVEDSSKQVTAAVNELAQGNMQIAEMVQQSAADIGRTNAFIKSIDEDVYEITSRMEKATGTVDEGNNAVQSQKRTIADMIQKFEAIQSAVLNLSSVSKEIGEIINAISGISEQTNLLSLNAAIEAARAGEAGKGFGVVADEIRKLSDNTKQSTEKIKSLIDRIKGEVSAITEAVENGSSAIAAQNISVGQTEESFMHISTMVRSILDGIKSISDKTGKLTEYSGSLNGAMENISAVTEETAAEAQEANASVSGQAFSLGLINERILEFSSKISTITEEMNSFKYVKVAHREYDDSIIQFEVFREIVRRRLGYSVEGIQVPASELFKAVADGTVDGTFAPWLPISGAAFLEKYGDGLENAGPNMYGCRYGLVVPAYVNIDGIADMKQLAGKFGGRIYSVERKTFIGAMAADVVKQYGLDEFTIDFGNESTMLAALDKCFRNKQWIAITGWQPHWKFGAYDLKFLKDPLAVMGKEEYTGTLIRKDLQTDDSQLYSLFKGFKLEVSALNTAISKVRGGMSHKAAARELADLMEKNQ